MVASSWSTKPYKPTATASNAASQCFAASPAFQPVLHHAQTGGSAAHRLPEGGEDLPGQVHVLEHALQLVGELRPALRLELAYHRLLRIRARALAQQQALGEVPLVERLEHILALRARAAL